MADSGSRWNIVVRVLHWAIVLAFVAAYASGDDWFALHTLAGYVVLGLVLLRVVVGLFGPAAGRLGWRPSALGNYAKQLVWLERPRYLATGGASGIVLTLLVLALLLTAITGALMYFAPLAPWTAQYGWMADGADDAHEACASAAIVIAVFHAAGVTLDNLLHRDRTDRTMLTHGRSEG
jgi:cytochrome b